MANGRIAQADYWMVTIPLWAVFLMLSLGLGMLDPDKFDANEQDKVKAHNCRVMGWLGLSSIPIITLFCWEFRHDMGAYPYIKIALADLFFVMLSVFCYRSGKG